ncbi:hypothetical protein D5086_005776 [Populus alba]|uniref:Uncharacterized protein n=1 Tax=Populus alba TaxID=43335 RepID=A0ACC4CUZ0_POPAL
MSEATGQPQEEDKKPNDQSAHINLKVKGQDGNEVFFRIKRSTQLKKLMNAYCDRQSVEINSIAFLFDGRRLRGEQTPDELEMEDGDEIDAMLHQTGGAVKTRRIRREKSNPPPFEISRPGCCTTVGLVRDGRPVLLPAWKLKVLTRRCACDFRITKSRICLQGQVFNRICVAVAASIAKDRRCPCYVSDLCLAKLRKNQTRICSSIISNQHTIKAVNYVILRDQGTECWIN